MSTISTSIAFLPALLDKTRAVMVLWSAWIASAASAVDAPAQRFAVPAASSATPAPAAGLAQVTLSLIVVLAAVFAAAWLLRRFRLTSGGGKSEPGATIAVLSERAVGPRERVVLLQVGDARVLVGVAAGSVRALHVMAGAAAATATAPELRQ